MQESHRKGLASHPDPRSCGGHREVAAEAWIGASAGWAIERRKAAIGVPTLLDFSGRPHSWGAIARVLRRPRVVDDPKHVEKLPAREPGGLGDV